MSSSGLIFSLSNIILFGMLILALIAAAVIVIVVIAVSAGKKKKPEVPSSAPENITPQQEEIRKTLSETLRELRTERNMTQEFVAESLGVSRQAVSKWENGTSEPSTSNLVAIAKLYEVLPEELLKKLI